MASRPAATVLVQRAMIIIMVTSVVIWSIILMITARILTRVVSTSLHSIFTQCISDGLVIILSIIRRVVKDTLLFFYPTTICQYIYIFWNTHYCIPKLKVLIIWSCYSIIGVNRKLFRDHRCRYRKLYILSSPLHLFSA